MVNSGEAATIATGILGTTLAFLDSCQTTRDYRSQSAMFHRVGDETQPHWHRRARWVAIRTGARDPPGHGRQCETAALAHSLGTVPSPALTLSYVDEFHGGTPSGVGVRCRPVVIRSFPAFGPMSDHRPASSGCRGAPDPAGDLLCLSSIPRSLAECRAASTTSAAAELEGPRPRRRRAFSMRRIRAACHMSIPVSASSGMTTSRTRSSKRCRGL